MDEEYDIELENGTVVINISQNVPLDWALPLYGYLMPILVAVTTTTNLFIVVVLSQRHLRTPTNSVLLTMAITDLLTGWTSVPWFIYYYTLGGYLQDQALGLTPFWCHALPYLSDILPSIFHNAAIWLTVFLAVQRYVYVCVPNSVYLYCTPRTTKLCITGIFILWKGDRYTCEFMYAGWVAKITGINLFFTAYFWLRLALHATPCALLLIFTCKLARTIKAAEVRKRSWATESMYERRVSVTSRCSANSSGRSMYATNRMLAVICTVFLFLEIPAAIVFGLQITLSLKNATTSSDEYFDILNRMLIIRHILIVFTSPIQFGIYCSMSEQFRLTARQLFTSRLLFVAQAQATFHGGKRYSLILVDVDTFEARRRKSSRRSLLANRKSSVFETAAAVFSAPKRKVGRQVSFPDDDPRERERSAHLGRVHHPFQVSLRRTSEVTENSKEETTSDLVVVADSLSGTTHHVLSDGHPDAVNDAAV